MSAKCQKQTLANLPEHVRQEKQETFAAEPYSDMRDNLPVHSTFLRPSRRERVSKPRPAEPGVILW